MKAIIVGAGISGLTAGVLLSRAGWQVDVFETRDHIGGNCYDYIDSGVYVHKYGPHIFHTDSDEVVEFLADFTSFTGYRHKVLAVSNAAPDKLLPIPYSRRTEEVIGRSWSDDEIRDALFVDYSQKMWGCSWDDLPGTVTKRVPQRRSDFNDEYFTDKHQGMPFHGYTDMFIHMAEEIGPQNVHVCSTPTEWRNHIDDDTLVVYTGSIDTYFGEHYGPLRYRTLDFKFSSILPSDRQASAVINQCNAKKYTRCTDFSRFYTYEDLSDFIPVLLEYPREFVEEFGDERIYPVTWGDDKVRAEKYNELTLHENSTVFCGRLGLYQYLDMDDAVLTAMEAVKPYVSIASRQENPNGSL